MLIGSLITIELKDYCDHKCHFYDREFLKNLPVLHMNLLSLD